MTEKKIAKFPLPCFGRIPNFKGSEEAANRVRSLPEWKKATIIFANPDFAQHKVRENMLREDKLLIMASPKLKYDFLWVAPDKVQEKESFASTIKGAFKHGRKIEANNLPKPNLVVTGCVAVDKHGHRLGKGGGFGDQELQLLKRRFGNIPVVTTVHDTQLVKLVPYEAHDESVDIIVTPTRIVRVKCSRTQITATKKWGANCFCSHDTIALGSTLEHDGGYKYE